MLLTKVVSAPKFHTNCYHNFQLSVLTEFNVPFTRLRDIQKQLCQLNNDLKRCMDECKDIYVRNVERLQRERDAAIVAASQMDDQNNINAQLPPGVEISNKKASLLIISC
jgi:deformed epidermal autoregulatory factor 1